ncbi:hypothetical protein RYW84_003549 [Salmonella enterica]|nr:hypothetical protein [Salmonella enterica]EKR1732401.1 hypothetical protein [Salmonella enterica subsp. enterica serovar Madelia]EGK5854870.1 hypothetical protein [Salmonella enterica]EGO0706439.1 hypothetical protein [Salmonella enterica]ELM3229473.1 hypothetical protein [Salmonella enterica]
MWANTTGILVKASNLGDTDVSNIATSGVDFTFEGFLIRTVLRNREPWFVAQDVCSALGLRNPTMALSALDNDERAKFNLGRQGLANIINESGLYTLILRCRDAVKPGTVPHRFRKWVTNEVLPAIRKTGRYEHPVCKPQPKSEPLTPADMQNLSYLVTIIANNFKRDRSWSMGIWFALRRATGVPSPQPFTVDDLPALTEECRRILSIADAASDMIYTIEKEVVRRIFRNREDSDYVLEQLAQEIEESHVTSGMLNQLERYEQIALKRLEQRVV